MTVHSIETVQDLIEEMQSEGTSIGSAWEYTNKMYSKVMFAVFTASQFCDIYQSPNVLNPELIWTEGKFIGAKYEYLNEMAET